MDKAQIFDLLNLHLDDPDQEIQHTALQLIQVGSCGDDVCMMTSENSSMTSLQRAVFIHYNCW